MKSTCRDPYFIKGVEAVISDDVRRGITKVGISETDKECIQLVDNLLESRIKSVETIRLQGAGNGTGY